MNFRDRSPFTRQTWGHQLIEVDGGVFPPEETTRPPFCGGRGDRRSYREMVVAQPTKGETGVTERIIGSSLIGLEDICRVQVIAPLSRSLCATSHWHVRPSPSSNDYTLLLPQNVLYYTTRLSFEPVPEDSRGATRDSGTEQVCCADAYQ